MEVQIVQEAFDGDYVSYVSWRGFLIKALGGTWEVKLDKDNVTTLAWEFPEGKTKEDYPGLAEFLCHEYSGGVLSVELCKELSQTLRLYMPCFKLYAVKVGNGTGRIFKQGGYVAVTQSFIEGCEAAIAVNESFVYK